MASYEGQRAPATGWPQGAPARTVTPRSVEARSVYALLSVPVIDARPTEGQILPR